ncbi:M56 family metallopeptidase [Mesonia aquimarina]|uniref:M56 family metallopeptidase n=1 Tax=Mesonia aquimarina TaxID=1504967 RepID=UPI000EF5F4AE|nr:M56 family metallopeptidase [Mesonia aquimarina]
MILYSIQFSLFLAVFLAVYFFFFRKETFFQYNRIYLIVAPILAIVLPLLSFDFLQEQVVISQKTIQLPTILLGDFSTTEKVVMHNEPSTESFSGFLNLENCLAFIYVVGFLISCLLFYRKIWQLKQLRKKSKPNKFLGTTYFEVPQSKLAFTFFNQIFLGEEIQAEEKQQILHHELVHVKQLHSLDLLFFEILKLVFWFHPGIYFCQNQLKTLHEFIADQKVLQFSTKQNYYESLLNSVFNTEKISFINQFFNHSLIKKRIVMLQKTHSTPYKKLKFLLLIPLIFGMLTYVSCSEDNVEKSQDIENAEKPPIPPTPPTPPEALSLEDARLINQLQQELENMDKNGKSFMEISEAFMVEKDKHIKSKEAFYRMRVFSEWMLNNGRERKIKNGTWTDENEIRHQEMLDDILSRNYEEYVAYRKTQDKKDVVYSEGVSFTEVENVPIFPGCEGLEGEAAKKCMAEKVSEFVNSKFDTKKLKPFAQDGTNRIYVKFTIDENGKIKTVKARAAKPELSEEAEKAINQLPQMKPGEVDGKPVSVVYTLPIIFQVDK